jgi:hypothetical protein
MKRAKDSKSDAFEKRLVDITRRLPPERVIEVIDFAQFLEARAVKGQADEETMTEADSRWEALLSSAKSQRLLEKMADEALADLGAGKTRPLRFTRNGEIAPE